MWSHEPRREEDLHTICMRSSSLLHTRELPCWDKGQGSRENRMKSARQTPETTLEQSQGLRESDDEDRRGTGKLKDGGGGERYSFELSCLGGK